jgi:hypothetical protein
MSTIVCPLVLLLAIVLSALLRITASDYPFGIFKISVRILFVECPKGFILNMIRTLLVHISIVNAGFKKVNDILFLKYIDKNKTLLEHNMLNRNSSQYNTTLTILQKQNLTNGN